MGDQEVLDLEVSRRTRFPWFSNILVFKDFKDTLVWLKDMPVGDLLASSWGFQGYRFQGFQGYTGFKGFQDILASGFQRIYRVQGYMVSKDFKDTLVSEIHRISKFAGFQGYTGFRDILAFKD